MTTRLPLLGIKNASETGLCDLLSNCLRSRANSQPYHKSCQNRQVNVWSVTFLSEHIIQMEQFIIHILRGLSFATGALLCYGAFFLYEDEENKVQNFLEGWWIRVDDLKRVAVYRHSALTRAAAEFAGTVLDRIFGGKIFSLRAVAVAGCFSLISLYFIAVFVTNSEEYRLDSTRFYPNQWVFLFAVLAREFLMAGTFFFKVVIPPNLTFINIVFVSAMIAVILPTLIKRFYWLPLVVFTAFTAIHLYLATSITFFLHRPSFADSFALNYVGHPTVVLGSVIVGVACDVVAIALTRILLRWQADWTSLYRTSFAALLQLIMAIALIVLPIMIGILIPTVFKFNPQYPAWVVAKWPIIFAFMLSSSTNLLSAIVALAFFGAASILLIHRFLWPFFIRPLYRLARGGVFRTPAARTALGGVGVVLILFAEGKGEDLLSSLLTLLGAF